LYTPKTAAKTKTIRTPLTQANRSAGRDAVRKKPKRESQLVLPDVVSACVTCGAVLDSSDRVYCDDCLTEFKQENSIQFGKTGAAALAKLRGEGKDPAHTEKAKAAVAKTVSKHQQAVLAWNANNERPDKEEYLKEILPLVEKATLPQLMKATGLSIKYCADIRKGRVPHARHWEALRVLHPKEVSRKCGMNDQALKERSLDRWRTWR